MALFKIDKTYFDTFAVRTEPKRTFTSSSANGIVGDISVFPLASIGLKEVKTVSDDDGPPVGDDAVPLPEVIRHEILAERITASGLEVSSASQSALESYMQAVNQQSVTVKNQKKVEVLRFEPSFKFTSDTIRKLVVQNVLFPYYRPSYGTSCNWAFTNYHTLNFFTAPPLKKKSELRGSGAKVFGSIPKQSALIYPFSSSSNRALTGSCYSPSTAFSFEFYINPRYGQDTRSEEYHAGTLFHVSSSYAISIISGSSKDPNGFVDKFRLSLQLSSSAEIPPSSCSIGSTTITSGNYHPQGTGARPDPLLFVSDDNVLTKNKWHHVCIRWGGDSVQSGTGSFVVDGIEKGTFDLPSSKLNIYGKTGGSIRQDSWVGAGPDALFIGNFYEGANGKTSPEECYIAQFFNPKTAKANGLINMYPGIDPNDTTGASGEINKDPQAIGPTGSLAGTQGGGYALNHPLRAEVHELKIWKSYRYLDQLKYSQNSGVENLKDAMSEGLSFYVPPFFTKHTKVRDILQTPFQTVRGTTDDPFNVPLAFGVGGHYLNLENFVKDFITGEFPRLFNLAGSEITTQTGWFSCNDFLYATGSVAKRNLTILPNDNGKFRPNFDLLKQDAEMNNVGTLAVSSSLSLFVNDHGRRRLDLISLNNLLATGSDSMGYAMVGENDIGFAGPSPDDPSIPTGSILTIFNRTRDATSDQVSFFDASNLFYGDRIKAKSYFLNDDNLTGSNGQVGITLRDNGNGNLYRADCSGSHAEWASVGTVLYDEGLAIVKAPTLPRFGADQFKVSMRGKRDIYVLQISVPAPAGSLDLSTNPTYEELAPSFISADENEVFTYLTNLNFLDENLNVICKSNFSQAIIKRVNDRMMVRIRLDF